MCKRHFQCWLALFSIISFQYASAQVTGTVFRDYNGNGTRQSGAGYTEPGVSGIIIKAFNASDVLLGTLTTTATGTYSFTAGQIPSGTAVRLEFTIPSSGSCDANSAIDYPSGSGSVYGTSVKFLVAGAGATNVNFAINNPADYRPQAAPFSGLNMYVPFMHTGNPAGGGTSGTSIAFYKFPYNNNGNTIASNGATPPNATDLATNAQIGTCYGVAYSRYADRVFTSAFMKRHAGFGPANGTFANAPGAIYIINPNLTSSTNAAAYFTSLDALGFPTHNSTGSPAYGAGTSYNITGTGAGATIAYTTNGLGVIGTNANRSLPANKTTQTNDPAAFGQVGKVSLGALEMSDDGKYLFVVNLFDRKLYQLQLNSVTAPTAATVVGSWSLPNPPLRSASGITNAAATYTGGNNSTGFYDGTKGLQRPFAVKYYRGKVYVGAVTTGENGGTTNQDNNTGNPEYTDLWAYVWAFDPATSTFNSTPVLQTPLNFARGVNGDSQNESWKPWTNTFPTSWNTTNTPQFCQYQQPIFSDIEFDTRGTMILGFRDRFGDQSAYDEFTMNSATRIAAQSMGDVYRAYFNQSTCVFEMEQNAKEGPSSALAATAGANNGMGPGNYTTNNGEFYFRDEVYNANTATTVGTFHLNCLMGGLALVPGTDTLAITSMDPQRAWSGGISWFSSVTGDNGRDYEMYAGTGAGAFPVNAIGDPGKANGLGDIEIASSLPPIEIGHRVWADTDGDGIQDAGESGLGGVEVELVLQSNGSVVATCTTDASGNYFFISGGAATTGTGTVVCALQPATAYIIRIKGTVTANKNITGNAGLNNTRFLTFPNVTGNGATDLSDNDGTTLGTGSTYQVALTTGDYGQNQQNVDFGFAASNVLPLQLLQFTASLQSSQVKLQWKVADAGEASSYMAEWAKDGLSYQSFAAVPGTIATDYSAVHSIPIEGKNFYRLKLIKKDNTYFYSPVRVIDYTTARSLAVYPNPVSNYLTVMINGNMQASPLVITLYSLDGKLLTRKYAAPGTPQVQMDLHQLPSGKYSLLIQEKSTMETMMSSIVEKL